MASLTQLVYLGLWDQVAEYITTHPAERILFNDLVSKARWLAIPAPGISTTQALNSLAELNTYILSPAGKLALPSNAFNPHLILPSVGAPSVSLGDITTAFSYLPQMSPQLASSFCEILTSIFHVSNISFNKVSVAALSLAQSANIPWFRSLFQPNLYLREAHTYSAILLEYPTSHYISWGANASEIQRFKTSLQHLKSSLPRHKAAPSSNLT